MEIPKKTIAEMDLDEKKRDAFNLLCSCIEIEDFHTKLIRGEGGYLRFAAISHLTGLYGLHREVTEEVIDTYIDHAARWQENIDLATGGADAKNN